MTSACLFNFYIKSGLLPILS